MSKCAAHSPKLFSTSPAQSSCSGISGVADQVRSGFSGKEVENYVPGWRQRGVHTFQTSLTELRMLERWRKYATAHAEVAPEFGTTC